jgi:hypothetical protein
MGKGTCLALAILLSAPLALADEITETIDEALKQYNEGNMVDAAGNLDYAAQLIRQKRGGDLQSLLPEPLPGWTAEEASSQATGAAGFGGMVTAERAYAKGDASVTITIVADSPMLQGMMMMFSNPMLATADGGKLQKINGQRAIVKFDDGEPSGEVTVAVAGRFLVTVKGEGLARQELVDYAGAIDFAKLEKF